MNALFPSSMSEALARPLVRLGVLIGIAAVQTAFIFGLVLWNQVIFASGDTVRLRSEPVDPPSLFRGNYVDLAYDISEIDLAEIASDEKDWEEYSGRVWVTLKKESDSEWWGATTVNKEKSDLQPGEVAIRGKVLYADTDAINVEYGIEQYFIPQKYEDEANQLLSGWVDDDFDRQAEVGVDVVVHSSGRARVKEVVIGGVALSDLLSGRASKDDIKTQSREERDSGTRSTSRAWQDGYADGLADCTDVEGESYENIYDGRAAIDYENAYDAGLDACATDDERSARESGNTDVEDLERRGFSYFVSDPSEVQPRETTVLQWNQRNATSCRGFGDWELDQLPPSGIATVYPKKDMRFGMTCTGKDGASTTYTGVNVDELPVDPQALRREINLEAVVARGIGTQQVWLRWDASNFATSCTAGGAWSGTKPVRSSTAMTFLPTETSVFTISCKGPGGSAADSVKVGVWFSPYMQNEQSQHILGIGSFSGGRTQFNQRYEGYTSGSLKNVGSNTKYYRCGQQASVFSVKDDERYIIAYPADEGSLGILAIDSREGCL